jgi:hypothetical protein
VKILERIFLHLCLILTYFIDVCIGLIVLLWVSNQWVRIRQGSMSISPFFQFSQTIYYLHRILRLSGTFTIHCSLAPIPHWFMHLEKERVAKKTGFFGHGKPCYIIHWSTLPLFVQNLTQLWSTQLVHAGTAHATLFLFYWVQSTVELSSYGGRGVSEQVQNCVISQGKYFAFILFHGENFFTWKLVRGRDTQFAVIFICVYGISHQRY